MSGDYSRDSFDALRDFAGVFLQQGRAALDSDWNEMVRVFERRIRAGTVDTIGRAVVPRETIHGFEISPLPGNTIGIGCGRLYLNGMLLECHGSANFAGVDGSDLPDPVFDRSRPGTDGPEGVLDEMISPPEGDVLPYTAQPYWPQPAALPDGDGPHLVYLVAWQREVTPLENPSLLEPALGGVDTATRWQTVWQVRILPNVGDNATCATPDGELTGWDAEIAPSSARLTTDTIEIEDPENPCLVPPTDGYTGLENQFYRVELHSVGDTQADARFKYSRENASVAAAIESFAASGTRVTVARIGRDEILRFRAGDWVEITDDRREFDHVSGQMLRVVEVFEETRQIELSDMIDPNLIPAGGADTVGVRRSRVIRWDQRGVIRLTDGTPWANLDDETSDGLIGVPPDDRAIVLESGITVSFTTAGTGRFRVLDHWRFWARTAGTQIERLNAAPPDGVQRHYTRLAILNPPPAAPFDCRVFWPPVFTGEGCECTVCVTAEGHNSGAGTIQAAIDQIGLAGGVVCLEGGLYLLDTPVTVNGRRAITIRGQGMGTLIVYRGTGAAVRIERSLDVTVERLSLVVLPSQGPDAPLQTLAAGIAGTDTGFLAVRRVAVLAIVAGEARQDVAIALDGLAAAARLEECLLVAPVALGSFGLNDDQEERRNYLGLAELRVLDSILFGNRAAIRLGGTAFNLAQATFARNLMLGQDAGAILSWLDGPNGRTSVSQNTVVSNGDAFRLGVNRLLLECNDVTAGDETGDGVRLLPGPLADTEGDADIVGNTIDDLAGAGIRIETEMASLLVKRNVIRRCGTAGITTAPGATIRNASIDNNVVEEIASGREQGAGGIVVTATENLRIAGNTVRGVARSGSFDPTYAAIAFAGCGSVAVEGNRISEVGPAPTGAGGVGILGIGPFGDVAISGNRIEGADVQADGVGRWQAIQLGPGLDLQRTNAFTARAVPGVEPTDLVVTAAGSRVFALSRFRLVDLGNVREAQFTALGNQIRQSADEEAPLVLIDLPGGFAAVFGENQVRLATAGRMEQLVLIAAQRIVAANNVVRRESDADAMTLFPGIRSGVTVLGNITFGNIRVQPGGMPGQFQNLNVLA